MTKTRFKVQKNLSEKEEKLGKFLFLNMCGTCILKKCHNQGVTTASQKIEKREPKFLFMDWTIVHSSRLNRREVLLYDDFSIFMILITVRNIFLLTI